MKYRIDKNDILGRYMVADKDLKAGEVILTENPTLIGPQIDGALICFNCCKLINRNNYSTCTLCDSAILCNSNCKGLFHETNECLALKNLKIRSEDFIEQDQIIYPLRCLLLRKYKHDVWNKFLELESHLEQRRNTAIWRRYCITVEKVLKDLKLLTEDDIKSELLQTICGILDVNTFEIRPPNIQTLTVLKPEIECLRGLYMEAALMAHDCIANTFLSVDDDFTLKITASVDIKKNQPIFFNYSNALNGNFERKMHLKEGKYFECKCRRCTDPSELNTEISSLKCHRCKKGFIRIKDCYREKSNWVCSSCCKEFTHYLIESTVNEGRRRLHDTIKTNVTEAENLLKTLTTTFSNNHYLVLELKQNLIGIYSNQPPYKKFLSRKVELCNEIFDVLTKIEPGISRTKAITLYQMQSAMIDLAHKEHRDKDIKDKVLLKKLCEAEVKLKESIKYLLYEPSKSPEGKIIQMALSELKMLRESIESLKLKDTKKKRNKMK